MSSRISIVNAIKTLDQSFHCIGLLSLTMITVRSAAELMRQKIQYSIISTLFQNSVSTNVTCPLPNCNSLAIGGFSKSQISNSKTVPGVNFSTSDTVGESKISNSSATFNSTFILKNYLSSGVPSTTIASYEGERMICLLMISNTSFFPISESPVSVQWSLKSCTD